MVVLFYVVFVLEWGGKIFFFRFILRLVIVEGFILGLDVYIYKYEF